MIRNSQARAFVPLWKPRNPRHASSMVSCTRSSADAGSGVKRRATRSRAARCGIAIHSNSCCCVGTSLHLTACNRPADGPVLIALLLEFVQLRQHILAMRIGIDFQIDLLDGALRID